LSVGNRRWRVLISGEPPLIRRREGKGRSPPYELPNKTENEDFPISKNEKICDAARAEGGHFSLHGRRKCYTKTSEKKQPSPDPEVSGAGGEAYFGGKNAVSLSIIR